MIKATLSDVRTKTAPAEKDKTVLQVSPWYEDSHRPDRAGGDSDRPAQCAAGQRLLPHFPSWLPHDTVSLGLDLQGGSYLLLEVDIAQVQKDKAQALIGDIRAAFRKAHIPYHGFPPMATPSRCACPIPAAWTRRKSWSMASIPP